MKNITIMDQYGRELTVVKSEKEATKLGLKNYALITRKGIFTKGNVMITDRAGYSYGLFTTEQEAIASGLESYVYYSPEGKPVVIREGKPVLSSFFYLEEEGNKTKRWAKLINSTDPKKVEKALKSKENAVIVLQDGELVCQFITLVNVIWHDAKGRKFFLIDKYDREELEADHLGYITGESNGTYESICYIAFDGEKQITVPARLANEKGRWFRTGVNFKKEAYKALQTQQELLIAAKNKMVYARIAETGEFIMAHTNGSWENGKTASQDLWLLEYVNGEGGSWTNTPEEFFKRYEFFGVAEDGRAMFGPKDARYAWVHLQGDVIGCIPQWGDSMVAMSNPLINISNPDDVYACSYIIFYGKEDNDGAYIVIKHVSLGQDEAVVLEFAKALAGFVETTFGIPKEQISASNLNQFLIENLCVPTEDEGVEAKVASALA